MINSALFLVIKISSKAFFRIWTDQCIALFLPFFLFWQNCFYIVVNTIKVPCCLFLLFFFGLYTLLGFFFSSTRSRFFHPVFSSPAFSNSWATSPLFLSPRRSSDNFIRPIILSILHGRSTQKFQIWLGLARHKNKERGITVNQKQRNILNE